jgi:dTDP-4-amino-4,6-dideoxygalactose transaminase
MQSLLDAGVASRRGVMCIHREPAYQGVATAPLPNSEHAQDRCVLLPLYTSMTLEDQQTVVGALVRACARWTRTVDPSSVVSDAT